ncbi:MAG: hypothetical protein HND48_01905 [Chloroflexi bacterium]|nr:hypothetical protein [Chloroflexota bacterium]
MPKRLTGFAGVIFDMDGLLVDSETVWHIVEAEFFADRGVTYTDADRQARDRPAHRPLPRSAAHTTA